MHHLIIKSLNRLDDIIHNFTNKGLVATGLSVINIDYLSLDKSQFNDILTENTHFIFTSIYAVKSLAYFFKPTTQTAFCVGDATANQAQQAGFTKIITPTIHTSTALSRLLLEKHNPNDTHYFYCTGINRKPFLESFLTEHTINYKILELYAANPINNFSEKTLFFLSDIFKKDTDKITIICLSKRNALIFYDLIVQAGFETYFDKIHAWHIVGNENATTDFLFKNIYFYESPQELYNYFLR